MSVAHKYSPGMNTDFAAAPGDVFELLFVCTANRARSAIAEHVVRAAAAGLPLAVGSAAMHDYGSLPPLPGAIEAAEAIGLDLSAHRSRLLLGLDLSKTDLVVGFERQHIACAVVDAGVAHERAFLLPELVRLLRETPAKSDDLDGARQAVAAAHARRAVAGAGTASEIADPVGGGAATFRATTTTIRGLAHELIELLFARPVRSAGKP